MSSQTMVALSFVAVGCAVAACEAPNQDLQQPTIESYEVLARDLIRDLKQRSSSTSRLGGRQIPWAPAIEQRSCFGFDQTVGDSAQCRLVVRAVLRRPEAFPGERQCGTSFGIYLGDMVENVGALEVVAFASCDDRATEALQNDAQTLEATARSLIVEYRKRFEARYDVTLPFQEAKGKS